jgi:hypothetical protein
LRYETTTSPRIGRDVRREREHALPARRDQHPPYEQTPAEEARYFQDHSEPAASHC